MRPLSILARAVTALLVASSLAVMAPATAAPTVPTDLVLEVSPTGTAVYGTSLSLDGQAVYVDPEDGETYAALGTYRLERRYAGEEAWVLVEDQVVDNPFWAIFDFEAKATRNADYRVTYLGDDTLLPSEASATVRVSRKVKSRTTEPRDNVFYLSGRVVPDYEGRKISLMRKKCSSCSWRVYASKDTSSTSTYRFRLPLPPRGDTHYFRTRVAADTRFVKSFSSTWKLSVW